ncbi:diacylglycerol kinase family protein [Pararoseomonas sp. SCSIO 73927]|uniref:diacylglycerol kinase family protein n=1 Tax=Pararoseomonas sp. SCSIO 73927 TaxID=3114537 RepID=UPI0030D05693
MSAPRIGLITNPLSRALQEGRHRLDGAATAGMLRAAPDTPEALRFVLGDFAARGVELLAVQGGDGTLREVLTALPSCFEAPPAIALLATGKTNLAARVLGTAGPGEKGLAALRRAAEGGTLRRRAVPVLEVARPGLDEAPMRGFLLGAGALTVAKEMADRRLHGRGIHDRLAVGLALAGTAFRAIAGRGHPLRAGYPMDLSVDGRPTPPGRRSLFLATPLDRLMLGLWPFWGGGDGPLRWLDVQAPPRRLAAAILAARRNTDGAAMPPWMAERGYGSGRAARISLRLKVPFVLDGEVYEPGPEGLLLSAPTTATFAAP